MKFWRDKAAIGCICLFLALLLPLSCGPSQTPAPNSGGDMASLDSEIQAQTANMFTHPLHTITQLRALQSKASDSATWLQIELYVAIAKRVTGDSLAPQKAQQAAIDYCYHHPGHDLLEGMAWNHRGITAAFMGRLKEARTDLDKACRLIERGHTSGTVMPLVNAYINAADAYSQSGIFGKAALRYRRALFLADSAGLKKILPAINSGLGQVYFSLDNYPMAQHFLDQAETGIKDETDYGKLFFYTIRGNCYFFERQYEKALTAFQKAREHALKITDEEAVVRTECNIGETLLKAGRTKAAAPYIGIGETYVKKHPDINPGVRFYINSLALELALDQSRWHKADSLLRYAIDTTQVDNPRYLLFHYQRLQRYATGRGLWKAAYRYQTLAKHLDDSLKNRQTLNNIAEIEARYAQDTTLLRQRMVIADYRAKTSRQQTNLALAISGLVILGLLGFLIVITLKHRTDRRIRMQEEEMTRLRMDIIQNRMQPHYIFNVLGTILPKFSRYPYLSGSLGLLIDVLRGNLLVAGKTAVKVADERKLVERFVALHHLTHGANPTVNWDIEETVKDDMLLPAMCIQITVENSLKHAFPPVADSNSRIIISMHATNNRLEVIIRDNGRGFNPGLIPATGRDTGTGLRVLARTIDLLNARNTEHIVLDIGNRTDGASGTETRLLVPLTYRWNL